MQILGIPLEWFTVATFILGVATFVYVVLNYRHFKTHTRPVLNVFLEVHHGNVYLVIENAGGGTAYDVRLEATGDFKIGGKSLNEAVVFKNGIPRLGPNQDREIFLVDSLNSDRLFNEPREPFEIHVQYRGQSGRKIKEHSVVNFRTREGIVFSRRK